MAIYDLEKEMNGCTKCPSLVECRSRVVFGAGNRNKPKIMIIGEGPGETEDQDGIPFNPERGMSGKQLGKIFDWIGVDRDEDCFITNAVLCRPPNNRNPLFQEIKNCRERLLKQIDLIQPTIVVCLGKFAVQALTGEEFKGPLKQFFSDEFLTFELNGQEYKWIVTYHPSYLLRRASEKKTVMPHWKMIKDELRC